MTIRTLPGSKFFRSRRKARLQPPTTPWLPVFETRNPAVLWMRKAWHSRLAFIIRLLGHIPEFDRGIKRARFAVLRLTKVPAVLIEGGFLTERGESKLISNKDWRAKLAGAIGIGIENYRALPVKNQPPMIVADYRREAKSAPIQPVVSEGSVKEADTSLIELVGRSAFLPQQQTSTSSKRSSLESAPIVP